MGRSVYDYTIGKPDDFIQFVSNDFFAKEGFRLVNYKGEQVWKKGTGFLTAPSFIKLSYGNGIIHVEAWIKSFGEQPLDGGFYAAIPKSAHKTRVDTLINLLNQPTAIPNQQPGEAAPDGSAPNPFPAQPVPVAVHNPTGSAVTALVTGLISLLAGIWIPLAGVLCGGIAIASGRTGRTSTKKGMATVGLVTGIIGLVLSIIVWIANIVLSALYL